MAERFQPLPYNNEVYAIGVAVKPGQALPEGSTLEGSISISNEATVNLNGGDYFPKSENPGLKNYAIQGTIADVRFTESTYPVTISVGGLPECRDDEGERLSRYT